MYTKTRNLLVLLLVAVVVTLSAGTESTVSPVIKVPSKFRKIDKTSELAQTWGIKGVGIGNAIFSSNELPKGEEDKYKDVRNTFYYGKDKTIHCRVYLPGTYSSLINVVKSQNKKAKFVKVWALLKVDGPGLVGPREAKMSFSSSAFEMMKDWDMQRFDLLPYVGGGDQDFRDINLSKVLDGKKPGKYTVYLKMFLKFQTGTKLVSRVENGAVVTREEPTYTDYMIVNDKFTYIKK